MTDGGAEADGGNGVPAGAERLGLLERLADGLPAVLVVLASDGTIQVALGGVETLVGFRVEEVVGRNASEFVLGGQQDRALLSITEALSHQGGAVMGPFRVWLRHRHDGELLVEVWSRNLAAGGEPSGMECLILFESAQQHFDQVLAGVAEGVPIERTLALLSRALRGHPVLGECLFVEPAESGGHLHRAPDAAAVIGPPLPGPWDEVFSSGQRVELTDLAALPEPTRSGAQAAGFGAVVAMPVRDSLNGHLASVLVLWRALGDPLTANQADVVERAVMIASLALGRRHAERSLRAAAFEDPLTGLGNRRRLLGSVAERVADSSGEVAVLFIDFDGFKGVNDLYGHQTGDEVLSVAARRIVGAIRPSDEVMRIGGDEFAVVCHGPLATEQVTSIAERVIASVALPIAVDGGHAVEVGVSVGIAHGFPAGTRIDVLLAKADAALYEAKARGKGRWHLLDPVAAR